MRNFKKLLAVLAMVCMLTTGFSMITYAAEGELRFTDPSTTVGAEVEVDGRIYSTGSDGSAGGNADV